MNNKPNLGTPTSSSASRTKKIADGDVGAPRDVKPALTPKLRVPEFQNAGEWEIKPFEEFVTKSFYGTSSSTSPTGKYPVLRMGNMVNGGLDFTNLVYLDLDADSFESFRLEDGDILLNRTNSPALVGKISLFRLKSECMTASYIVTYRLVPEQSRRPDRRRKPKVRSA